MEGVITKIFSELGYKVDIRTDAARQYYSIYIDREWESIGFFKTNKKILFLDKISDKEYDELKTLFYNEVLPKGKTIENFSDLVEFIELNYPDRSPGAKADRVLLYLHRLSNYDGESVSISDFFVTDDQTWRRLFLNSWSEFSFYLDYLIDNKFLSWDTLGSSYAVCLTVKGLEKIIKVNEATISKTCFIAMSFDEEMFKIYYEAIRPAIIETGFEPLIISEKKDIPSDTTINDAILAAIKKSKFTIADFTNHKHGVYFESGYALGRGQKVIYTCRQDEIGKAHFDTRNYPHIIWKDAEDLKKQLIDKIEVFIKS